MRSVRKKAAASRQLERGVRSDKSPGAFRVSEHWIGHRGN